MTAAAQGSTTAHPAVMPTSPARTPLRHVEMGNPLPRAGRLAATTPRVERVEKAEATVVDAAARAATSLSPPDMPSVEPQLKPNQQNSSTKTPRATRVMFHGLKSLARAAGRNLATPASSSRGPVTAAPTSAVTPPTACTTADPAKSTMPQPKSSPGLSQPSPLHAQCMGSGATSRVITAVKARYASRRTRSARAPETIVAVVAAKANWNTKCAWPSKVPPSFCVRAKRSPPANPPPPSPKASP
mmetsp:Transcript_14307/g.49293  ORF Transcript_14307/g.49293 Transcript_14307/m.49293 type:complete len:244 (-) Transcript_14307:104-835(-)